MTIIDEQTRKDLMWYPGTHPIHQARFWTSDPLYEWQREALVAAAMPHSRAIVSTCNEAGKTSTLITIFGFSIMCRFPGASVFSTSASDRQVKFQLFEDNIVPIVQELEPWGWTYTKTNMRVTAPNGSTWMCYVCSDATNVEGFHGKRDRHGVYHPVAYTIDECKGVHDDVEQAVRRIDPDFMLAVSTPGKDEGFFYEAFEDVAF